jgi:AmiR/NasT family two-component response regulator
VAVTLANFAGRRALVIHRADHHRAALETQLSRFALTVLCRAPSAKMTRAESAVDVVFFDADSGHDCLFPWGSAPPPMPLIAILGSEAPGRIEWALSKSASAVLTKPIGSSGAFQALMVASHLHGEMQRLKSAVSELSDRVRARPLVVRATLELMRHHQLDEHDALNRLRRVAMSARMTVEELSSSIVATPALIARMTEDCPPLALIGGRSHRTSEHS